MVSFSVVALVKESEEILTRFVTYYASLGARRVKLYYDEPNNTISAKGLSNFAHKMSAETRIDVELTFCDQAFWQDLTKDPVEIVSHKQILLYRKAYEAAEEDWLLICDADEFLINRIPVNEFLSAVPGNIDSLLVPPAEAVWGPNDDIDIPFGSSWFRRPKVQLRLLGTFFAARLYGRRGPLYSHGILSHTRGKQFLRRNRNFSLINIHTAQRDGKVVSVPVHRLGIRDDGLELAHFDAIDFQRWSEKINRRIANPERFKSISRFRRRQVEAFAAAQAEGPSALRQLFRDLYKLDAQSLQHLEARGLAFNAKIFPSAP